MGLFKIRVRVANIDGTKSWSMMWSDTALNKNDLEKARKDFYENEEWSYLKIEVRSKTSYFAVYEENKLKEKV